MPIRPLTPDDAPAYLELRREALSSEPLVFLTSPEDGLTMDLATVRHHLGQAPESVTFGAFAGDRLTGAVGLYRAPKRKAAHRAHLWRLYVRPPHRRRGAARALVAAALDHARATLGVIQVHLGVSERAEPARRLYESLGFRTWGTEPRWLHHDGHHVALHHMLLRLDGEPRVDSGGGEPPPADRSGPAA